MTHENTVMYFPKPSQELTSHEVIMLEFWTTAFPLWSDNKRIDRRTQSRCETVIPLLNYYHSKCDSGSIEMNIIMYQTVVKARIKSLVNATKILLGCNSDVDWAFYFSLFVSSCYFERNYQPVVPIHNGASKSAKNHNGNQRRHVCMHCYQDQQFCKCLVINKSVILHCWCTCTGIKK